VRAGLGLGLDNLHLIDVQDIDQAGGPNGDVKTEQGIEKDDIRRGLHATSLDSMQEWTFRQINRFASHAQNSRYVSASRSNPTRGAVSRERASGIGTTGCASFNDGLECAERRHPVVLRPSTTKRWRSDVKVADRPAPAVSQSLQKFAVTAIRAN